MCSLFDSGLCRWRQVVRRIVAAGLLLLCAAAFCSTAEAALQWSSVTSGQVHTWNGKHWVWSRDAEASTSVLLEASDVLLVPVKRGALLRVRGAQHQWGLAYTGIAGPSAIVWSQQNDDKEQESLMRIPLWSEASHFAVRSRPGTSSRVSVAASQRQTDGLSQFRFNGAVYHWLGTEGNEPPVAPSADAAADFESLQLTRELLIEQARLTGLGVEERRALIQPWLQGTWLVARVASDSLASPFFRKLPALLSGGRAITTLPSKMASDAKVGLVEARAGEVLRISAPASTLIVLEYQQSAADKMDVEVLDGTLVVRRLHGRSRSQVSEFMAPRRVRLPHLSSEDLVIRVNSGTVRFVASGYAVQHALLDSSGERNPRIQLMKAMMIAKVLPVSPFADFARQSLTFSLSPSRRGQRELERAQARWSPVLRALSGAQLLPQWLLSPDGVKRFQDWLTVTSRLATRRRSLFRRMPMFAASSVLPRPWQADSFDWASLPARSRDERMIRVLAETIVLPADGGGAFNSARAERWAASALDSAYLARVARRSWLRAAPFRALRPSSPAASVWQMERLTPDAPGGKCWVDGPAGLRWSRLSPGAQTLRVVAPEGHHAIARFRTDEKTTRGVAVLVDDTAVHIHPIISTDASVYLTPGLHNLRVPGKQAVLGLIPRSGAADCGSLRRGQRWFQSPGSTTFELPGGVSSVVRIRIRHQVAQVGSLVVNLKTESASYEAMVAAGGTATLEIPITATDKQLRVTLAEGSLLRVSLRRHHTGASPDTINASQKHRAEAAVPSSQGAAIDDLRSLSQELSSVRSVDRASLHGRRARILEALGYDSYAAIERARSGGSAKRAASSALTQRSELLPKGGVSVKPRSLFSRVPLFDTEVEFAALAALKRQATQPQSGGSIEALITFDAKRAASAGTLLLSQQAEHAGRKDIAAAAYRKLAQLPGADFLQARALRLSVEAAAESGSISQSRELYQALRRAQVAGLDVGALLGRFAGAIKWRRVNAGIYPVGKKLIESAGFNKNDFTLGERVRRALTLAPPSARWVADSRRFSLGRFAEQELRVRTGCFQRHGQVESCRLDLTLNDLPLVCPARSSRATPSAGRATGCSIVVTPTKTGSLGVTLPTGAEGWVELSVLREGRWHAAPRRETFAIVTAAQPFDVNVMGPATLRLSARAGSAETGALTVEHWAPETGALTVEHWAPETGALVKSSSVTLPVEQGSLDQVYGSAGKVSGPARAQARTYITVAKEERLAIRIYPTTGQALVRVHVAQVVAPPKARVAPAEELASESESNKRRRTTPSSSVSRQLGPRVAEVSNAQPAMLGARLGYTDRDWIEAEAAPRDRYLQVSLDGSFQLIPKRLWLKASAFTRVRQGYGSWGAVAAASATGGPGTVGAFTRLRLTTQGVGQETAKGLRGLLGITKTLSLRRWFKLNLKSSITIRDVAEELRGRSGVDQDVYSRYAEEHALSSDFAVRAIFRPFVDTRGEVGVSSRMLSSLGGVDQLTLYSEWLSSALPAWAPWLGAKLGGSFRPRNEFRRNPFVRLFVAPNITLWKWLGQRQRLQIGASGIASADLKRGGGSPSLFGQIYVAFETFSAGLEALAPVRRRLRTWQEEGRPLASDPEGGGVAQ